VTCASSQPRPRCRPGWHELFVPVHRKLTEALTRADAVAAATHGHAGLPPTPRAPARAQEAVHRFCAGVPFCDGVLDPNRLDAALSVVTELATNAVQHGRSPVGLDLRAAEESLLIAVSDLDATPPIQRPIDEWALGGRGTRIVSALSTTWGVRQRYRHGKTVWAQLREAR